MSQPSSSSPTFKDHPANTTAEILFYVRKEVLKTWTQLTTVEQKESGSVATIRSMDETSIPSSVTNNNPNHGTEGGDILIVSSQKRSIVVNDIVLILELMMKALEVLDT